MSDIYGRYAMSKGRGHGVGVHLVLVQDGHVLLGQRANTGFADGWWHVPGGTLEQGEALNEGASREAAEELGIRIAPEDLVFSHLIHHKDRDGIARVGVCFTASVWVGEPTNMEPDKCTGLKWYRPQELPESTVDYAVAAIEAQGRGEAFSVFGW
jgi:8-oxo-dGTP pyrophosphatase MutT (NUDIX family)